MEQAEWLGGRKDVKDIRPERVRYANGNRALEN